MDKQHMDENRILHTLGVANKCYEYSKRIQANENFCRRMYLIGFLHDIGYQFSDTQEAHPEVSVELLKLINCQDTAIIEAIKNHGIVPEHKSVEWKILVKADMTIDSRGREVTPLQRLKDIRKRYGKDSIQYKRACKLCYETKLITEEKIKDMELEENEKKEGK